MRRSSTENRLRRLRAATKGSGQPSFFNNLLVRRLAGTRDHDSVRVAESDSGVTLELRGISRTLYNQWNTQCSFQPLHALGGFVSGKRGGSAPGRERLSRLRRAKRAE